MKKVTLSEDTVETLVQASRMGLITMERQARHAEDRYERNNIQGLIRRTEAAIQSVEGITIDLEVKEIRPDANQRPLVTDVGDGFSESKESWIEGRR
tara:strand:+ start:209 stop:499 length:291 start_codon:yes stop_codon:yes gene_type:complete